MVLKYTEVLKALPSLKFPMTKLAPFYPFLFTMGHCKKYLPIMFWKFMCQKKQKPLSCAINTRETNININKNPTVLAEEVSDDKLVDDDFLGGTLTSDMKLDHKSSAFFFSSSSFFTSFSLMMASANSWFFSSTWVISLSSPSNFKPPCRLLE